MKLNESIMKNLKEDNGFEFNEDAIVTYSNITIDISNYAKWFRDYANWAEAGMADRDFERDYYIDKDNIVLIKEIAVKLEEADKLLEDLNETFQ